MNTRICFYVKNGKVEKENVYKYLDAIREIAQDAIDELTGGGAFMRQTISDYMDNTWKNNIIAYNLDTNEEVSVELPNKMWIEYRDDILDEVKKIAGMTGKWEHDAEILVERGEWQCAGETDKVEFGHYSHPDLQQRVPAIRYKDSDVIMLPTDWQAYENTVIIVDSERYSLPDDYERWSAAGHNQMDEEGWRGDEEWIDDWNWLSSTGEKTLLLGGLPRALPF